MLLASTPEGAPVSTKTHAIGELLCTRYAYLFQLAGLILLVAMIGAIVLTLRHRSDVRRQNVVRQHRRTRAESVAVVSVPTGQGVS